MFLVHTCALREGLAIAGWVEAGDLSGSGRGCWGSSVGQRLNHLYGGSEPDWERWLAKRTPQEVRSANWWLSLFVGVARRTPDRSRARADWVRLHLWLIRRSLECGAFTAADTAIRIASCAAMLHGDGPVDDLAGVLPTADEIVGACLETIPVTIEQARILAGRDLRDLDLDSSVVAWDP